MDLPGVKKDDITVELSGKESVVTGDLKDGAEGQSSHRIRRSGHVEQRVLLPASAEADKVTASLSDGVLTVTVPKSEDQNPTGSRSPQAEQDRRVRPASCPVACRANLPGRSGHVAGGGLLCPAWEQSRSLPRDRPR
jgi:Hsp20/alpha crystallin family